VGRRLSLFSTGGLVSNGLHQGYDVTPDDQRFVMVRRPQGGEVGEVVVVENWFEELRTTQGTRR
jgi:hypothetical protein